jgi:L-serine dehydratase
VTYLSPGGGAIEVVAQDGTGNTPKAVVIEDQSSAVPTLNLEDEDISDYSSANELVRICEKYDKSIAEVARRQEEIHWGDAFDESKFNARIDKTWETMNACIDAGIDKANMEQPMMPGGLGVRKRAPEMFERVQKLKERGKGARIELLACYALAVNEQNAIGERIVTSPTAGSAGVIPAVIRWWKETEDVRGWSRDAKTKIEIRRFLLTAGVIGSIIKANGSISGAECGCQAEIGSACAMAAAGLAAVKGGSPAQVENAAEIALEYHFGLTCDPVGGLVLIPCIERNAMAANTAVTAASLALAGNGSHQVSLDTAIKTMRQTGIDMDEAYKETSRAGLATYVGC